jgi:hypothetical protein
MEEDKRLERLFDYTKWHIGIYLSIGGATVTLLASDKSAQVLSFLVGSKLLLGASLALMVVAGFAGGVIASSITTCKTFEEFWDHGQGPVEWKAMKGRHWPKLEHLAFWASLAFLGAGILTPSGSPARPVGSAGPSSAASAASAPASSVQRP